MNEQRSGWQVPADHPAFNGHFPGHPILPGVVLLDRAIFLAHSQRSDGGLTVSQCKFLSTVGPEEVLTFVLTPDARGGWRFAVEGADGRAVASGSLPALKA